MRVLIAGAGYVGAELAARLASARHEVLALRRSPPRTEAQTVAPRVRWLACDLSDANALSSLGLEGVEALAYLVAADARDDPAYRRAYVDGLANVLARLRPGRSLRRVLFVSSTSVYAQDDGSWLDEASPARPAHFAGQRLLAGEAIAREAGCESVALRLGGIYGPGRTSLIERVRRGQAQLASAPHYTNRIHRDDAARACAHLLAHPAPEPCYVGVDREPTDQARVLRWLATRLRVAPPSGDYDASAAPSGKRCRSDRLYASGFSFAYPTFREGYESLIDEA